jgi:hypothetical protein
MGESLKYYFNKIIKKNLSKFFLKKRLDTSDTIKKT